MRGRRKEHQWDFMGTSKGNERGEWKGELGYCNLCKKYRISTETGFTFITKKRYLELVDRTKENPEGIL